ncbi:MAG: class I SAM-dependent methyltransferase [Arcobacter sp.]|nr:class I SAM-dependent methyltransferase [Arcobacter sp.]
MSEANKLFYKKSIDKYGVSPLGVHWNSEFTQYKRFEILTSFIANEIKNSTIVDAGCGFGEYYKYLNDNNHHPKQYIGIDSLDEMVAISRDRFKDVEFCKQDILKDDLRTADYYLCSGAMNILSKKEFYSFIEKCYSASNKGFVFNFLKSKSFNKIKIDDVISFCSSLTNKIATKNDYLDNDFTIFMIK